MITSAQCRAGRALLNWSQEQLSTNAQVSRATVVDFERTVRRPVPNNLASIEESMTAAGVEFIGEDEDGKGVGARFRELTVEYSPDIRVSSDGVTFTMVYRSQRYSCDVPRDVLEDLEKANFPMAGRDELFKEAAQKNQHSILNAAERRLTAGVTGTRFELQHRDFNEALFR